SASAARAKERVLLVRHARRQVDDLDAAHARVQDVNSVLGPNLEHPADAAQGRRAIYLADIDLNVRPLNRTRVGAWLWLGELNSSGLARILLELRWFVVLFNHPLWRRPDD